MIFTMNEIDNTGTYDGSPPDQHYPDRDATGPNQPRNAAAEYAALVYTPSAPDDEVTVAASALETGEAARDVRAAQAAWLERRGIDPAPANTPHLTMTQQEFDSFRNAPEDSLRPIRGLYKIPQGDQTNCQYVLIDIVPDDPALPHQSQLVRVDDLDFGTVVEPGVIAQDFQTPDSSPDSPLTPESTYVKVDIGRELYEAWGELQTLAKKIIGKQTKNPLSGTVYWRAGGITFVDHDGNEGVQDDAYVFVGNRDSVGKSPIVRAIELTVNFPGKYDSVCAVSGEVQAAGNDKKHMAQVIGPEVKFELKGEGLAALQEAYRKLYAVPGFALTDEQRERRDILMNEHFTHELYAAARENSARASDAYWGDDSAPQYRHHE